jgi:hypothetical protein
MQVLDRLEGILRVAVVIFYCNCVLLLWGLVTMSKRMDIRAPFKTISQLLLG